MPIVNGAYDAPTWNNNAPPAIDASELQDMCDTIETYNTQKADVDYVNTFVRPNLLDNWYFVGGGSQQGGGQFPINQRGQTSYTNGYGIDRWYDSSGVSQSLRSDCVRLTTTSSTAGRSMRQSPENSEKLQGKTVTLSVLFGNVPNNAVYCGLFMGAEPNGATSTISISGNATSGSLMKVTATLNGNFSTYPYITALIGFVNNSAGVGVTADVKAAKLEIGSTQTLAHQENGVWVLNEVPNYQQELAKCRRYQLELVPTGDTTNSCVGTGSPTSSSNANIFVPTPSEMRTVPTVTNAGTWKLVRDGQAVSSGTTVSEISVVSKSANGITLACTASSLNTSYGCTLWNVGTGGTDSLLMDANLLLDANL